MQNKAVSAHIEPKKEIIRSVRYTPEEDALLDAKCTKTGLPKSVLIHDTSLGYAPPQLMTTVPGFTYSGLCVLIATHRFM